MTGSQSRDYRAPLDDEWRDLAKRQLKGEDPVEKLTWHTPEVSM